MKSQTFSILPGEWAIVRLDPTAPVPAWALAPAVFVSITRTAEELSIAAPATVVPAGIPAEGGWALLKLHGPLAFSQAGILASFATPLATAGIGIFAVSTFDTDYLLVKAGAVGPAIHALVAAGHVRAGPAPGTGKPARGRGPALQS